MCQWKGREGPAGTSNRVRRLLERAWELLGKLVKGQICQRKHWKGLGECWRVLYIRSKAKAEGFQAVSTEFLPAFCVSSDDSSPSFVLCFHYFRRHGAIKTKWNYAELSVKRNDYFTRQCHVIFDL